jgi:hypothetical protein
MSTCLGVSMVTSQQMRPRQINCCLQTVTPTSRTVFACSVVSERVAFALLLFAVLVHTLLVAGLLVVG